MINYIKSNNIKPDISQPDLNNFLADSYGLKNS